MEKTNQITIVGKLVSADVKTGFDKGGNSYVSTTAVIESVLDGVSNVFEVNFYSKEMTKDNKVSKLYTDYVNLPALAGKKVEVSANFRETRFWSTKNNQMASGMALSGRFVKGALPTANDEATFMVGGFILTALTERVNKNNEIYRYDLAIGQSNYNDTKMSKFTLHVDPSKPEIVRGARQYELGSTVLLKGVLHSIEESKTVESSSTAFGEPITKTYTNTIKSYFITAGSDPIKGEEAYSTEVIKSLVEAYKAEDAEIAAKAQNAAAESPAPAVENPAPAVTHRQVSLI